MRSSPCRGLLIALLAGALAACGSTSTADGGAVAGQTDVHCALPDGGSRIQETSQAACHVTVDGGVPPADFGDTLFNAAGLDDDCKYAVEWTSTAVRSSQDVTFTVKVRDTVSQSPVGGAGLYAEVFLSETHPAPNSPVKTTESPKGTYAIGPVRFDASGRWTVRFHIFGQCSDALELSPHGHIAFYLDVP